MALHDVTIVAGTLIGNWVAALVYGLNVTLCVLCLRIVGTSGNKTRGERILFIVTVVHIALATAHIAVSLAYLVRGFLQLPSSTTEAYYASQSTPLHLAQLWLYIFMTNVGDGIMAWRCYVVWKHSKAVGVVLTLLLVAFFVAGIVNTVKIARIVTLSEFFDAISWSTAVYTISLSIQTLSTSLIVWKIWTAAVRKSDMPNRSHNLAIIWMIIESGVILTGASAVILILFRLRLNAGGLVAPIHAQLCFFVPASIIARAGMRRAVVRVQGLPDIQLNRRGIQGVRHDLSGSTDIPLSPSFKTSKTSTVDVDVGDTYGSMTLAEEIGTAQNKGYKSDASMKAVTPSETIV